MIQPIKVLDDGIIEANRRQVIVQAVFEQMKHCECSERQACAIAGVDPATFGRWRKRWEQNGFNGLIPSTRNCGRQSIAEKLGLSEDVVLRVKGLGLDTESNITAWRAFAQSDRCPEDIADAILDRSRTSKHSIPPSLRSATKLTKRELDAHRGKRRMALKGIWTPRKLDILPGDIFTSDDTTPIWAWWVPWIQSDEYPFGVKLLQGQFLPVMDVASQCVLCYVLIAREKSSYRAADIWRLFGHTFEVIGLPRLGWQLERGSWEANVIAGAEVEYRDGEHTMSRRVGGLRSLPTNLTPWHHEKLGDAAVCFPKTLQTWTSFLPKSKSIEAWFHRNQALEGTIWGSLGRDQMRNPYEKTKKIYEECRRGKADPRNHFLSNIEMIKRLSGIIGYLNNEPMEGEVFRGTPSLLWQSGIKEYPLFQLEEEQKYLYQRDWKVLQIDRGWARVRLTDEMSSLRYSLFYGNPEVFAMLDGQRVIAYFDRQNFESPAQIHSATDGSFICRAEYFERRGSFIDTDLTGHDMRKRFNNAAISSYGTIVAHAPSRQLPPEIAARRAESTQITREAAPVVQSRLPQAPRITTPTEADFERRQGILARQAEAANRIREEINQNH